MKTLLFLILYIVVFPSSGLMAEDAAPLTIEQIKTEAERDFTDGARMDLMRRCLASQNLDFVKAFLQHTGLTDYMAEEAGNLEPSVYQDRVFLIILRSPWPYDTAANTPPSFRRPGPVVPALCVKVIAGRLPSEPLDLEDEKIVRQFADPAYRHQLANKFAAAIGEPPLEYNPPPEPPTSPSAPDNKAHPSTDHGEKRTENSARGAKSPEHLTWWIAGAVLLASLVVWTVMKRRGK